MKQSPLQLACVLALMVSFTSVSLGQSISSSVIGVTGGLYRGSTLQLAFSAGDVVTGAFEGETVGLGPVFFTDTTLIPTAVDSESELPRSLALHQNYPNPFNPSTTISFDLPQAANVVLTVYNTLGMKVGVVDKGYLQAGSHLVMFEGANLASGVYFYRLHVDGATKAVKKMALIK